MAGFVVISGCGVGVKRDVLLAERKARGQLSETEQAGVLGGRLLEPVTQTLAQGKVTVTATFMPQRELETFFANRQVFGKRAGKSPYFPENLVFYIRIANKGEQRIQIAPGEFVMIDDHGNQYSPIGVEYVTAIAESRQPIRAATRGLLEDARPGYFGFSVPVGKMVAGKPHWRSVLIGQASLQSGYLHPGVIHDGLVAFWSPTRDAVLLRLIVGGIKTDFTANDEAKASLEFPFTFTVAHP
jgi:hypothetical protein